MSRRERVLLAVGALTVVAFTASQTPRLPSAPQFALGDFVYTAPLSRVIDGHAVGFSRVVQVRYHGPRLVLANGGVLHPGQVCVIKFASSAEGEAISIVPSSRLLWTMQSSRPTPHLSRLFGVVYVHWWEGFGRGTPFGLLKGRGMVSEFIQGTSLKELALQPALSGKINLEALGRTASDLALSLLTAYQSTYPANGLLHGDLHLDNIMVDASSRIVFLDYDRISLVESDATYQRLDSIWRRGNTLIRILLTGFYRRWAPSHESGTLHLYQPRDELFSLCVILHHLFLSDPEIRRAVDVNRASGQPATLTRLVDRVAFYRQTSESADTASPDDLPHLIHELESLVEVSPAPQLP